MHLACEKMCLVFFQVVTFRKENATGIIFSSKHELTTRNLHAFAPGVKSTLKNWHGYCFCFSCSRQQRDCSGWFVFVQTDLKEPLPKIYVVKDSNCISRPLGHTWVGCQQPSDWTTAPSIRVSVGRLFFSDITIQLLSSKLMCFSTRINSRAVDIPYSSKDMPMVIFSTRRVLQYLYELEYCTVAVVYNCTYMVWKSFLFQLYIRIEFVRLGLHFHNQYGVFK